MSNLIINEPPLQVLPSLALAVGLNEAIVLQQLHYLLAFASTTHQGKKWVYNSHEEWQAKQFKFWSVATVKRTFASLQKQGLVVCKKLQSKYRNQTNFYTIDYDKLGEIQANLSAQNEPMHRINMNHSIRSNCTNGIAQFEPMSSGQNEPMLQENTNRIHTRENLHESEAPPPTQTHFADEKNLQEPSKNKTTGKTSSDKKSTTAKKYLTADDLVNLGVDNQVANDYLATRKTKLTQTAVNGIIKQASLAGLTLAQAIEFATEQGWQSFKAEWYTNRQQPTKPTWQPPQPQPAHNNQTTFDEHGNIITGASYANHQTNHQPNNQPVKRNSQAEYELIREQRHKDLRAMGYDI